MQGKSNALLGDNLTKQKWIFEYKAFNFNISAIYLIASEF